MKNLKINIPAGYEIDKEQSTFENIVFKEIKGQLPKSWGDLKTISGYLANGFDKVHNQRMVSTDCGLHSKQIFVTKEQAEASIALAQLSQLMKVYNDGWVPNWSNTDNKYCIIICDGIVDKSTCGLFSRFLAFKTPEIRNEFLKNLKI